MFVQRIFFSIITLVLQKSVRFIYSIWTLFSKIAHYLNKLSEALNLRHCSQNNYVIVVKTIRIIITIIIKCGEYA